MSKYDYYSTLVLISVWAFDTLAFVLCSFLDLDEAVLTVAGWVGVVVLVYLFVDVIIVGLVERLKNREK